MLNKLINTNFLWFPQVEIGYYPVSETPYNNEYFLKYVEYANTDKGRLITSARIKLVNKYYTGHLIDVGIGCGQFIMRRGNSYGYDINTTAVERLKASGLYRDLYSDHYEAATFWDSFEHLENPEIAISKIKKYVFVSIPIFTGCEHILNSKHFRPNEHYWYFTRIGLISWFLKNGFKCLENNKVETDLGREDIESFVFERQK